LSISVTLELFVQHKPTGITTNDLLKLGQLCDRRRDIIA